jgi:DNA helicase-2/ATP-dependent DNA helicase PcrA
LCLDPSFTLLDRADSADLLDVVRQELGQAQKESRFPQKATCLDIYSRTVNEQAPLQQILDTAFPWCRDFADDLKRLFASYVDAKQSRGVLDYDDLLLYWHHLMSEPALAQIVHSRFDHVLVDEYQDTNRLQASVLFALQAAGAGLTVVGDDAQSIYAFRAARVRNILDFPARFEPAATTILLEENYRSSQPILDCANAVISLSRELTHKRLFSKKTSAERPTLVTAADEVAEVDWVVRRILHEREDGVRLCEQAVLFRTSHHSDRLEVELARRNIPFIKYGGLRFLETAHVKDVLCVLRWAENPRDTIAGFRVLQILAGVGPALARRAFDHLAASGLFKNAFLSFEAPPAVRRDLSSMADLFVSLRASPWSCQMALVRAWYEPYLHRNYDDAAARACDLAELERLGADAPTRERFLSDLILDPPQASGDFARPPHLDEDFLILSTIHSAKGQEWRVVYVLHATDGCIPSDMACDTPEQIEEERRLLYVAMTRAKERLHLVHPLRFFVRQQPRYGDKHVLAPRTRFIPDTLLSLFACETHERRGPGTFDAEPGSASAPKIDVAARVRGMWGP